MAKQDPAGPVNEKIFDRYYDALSNAHKGNHAARFKTLAGWGASLKAQH